MRAGDIERGRECDKKQGLMEKREDKRRETLGKTPLVDLLCADCRGFLVPGAAGAPVSVRSRSFSSSRVCVSVLMQIYTCSQPFFSKMPLSECSVSVHFFPVVVFKSK